MFSSRKEGVEPGEDRRNWIYTQEITPPRVQEAVRDVSLIRHAKKAARMFGKPAAEEEYRWAVNHHEAARRIMKEDGRYFFFGMDGGNREREIIYLKWRSGVKQFETGYADGGDDWLPSDRVVLGSS